MNYPKIYERVIEKMTLENSSKNKRWFELENFVPQTNWQSMTLWDLIKMAKLFNWDNPFVVYDDRGDFEESVSDALFGQHRTEQDFMEELLETIASFVLGEELLVVDEDLVE